jgi:hypothetical protein
MTTSGARGRAIQRGIEPVSAMELARRVAPAT